MPIGGVTPVGGLKPGGTVPIGGVTPVGGRKPGGTVPIGGVTPVGGRKFGGTVPTGGVTPVGGRKPGGTVPIGGVTPVGGRKPGGTVPIGGVTPPGREKSGKILPMGGVMPGRSGIGICPAGGNVKPPFWFWVSSRQSLLPPRSRSLCTPPLPLDTTGDRVRCRPPALRVHSSTLCFPCAASNPKSPGEVPDNHTEREPSLVTPTKASPPEAPQLAAIAGNGADIRKATRVPRARRVKGGAGNMAKYPD